MTAITAIFNQSEISVRRRKTPICFALCWLRTDRLLGEVSHRHLGEPVVAILHGSVHDAEELMLQSQRYRTGYAAVDVDLVDRFDGRDFGGGAAEEDFVGNVEHLP